MPQHISSYYDVLISEIENAPRSCLRFADDDQTHAAHAPRAFTIRTQRRERNERTRICSNLHRFFEGRFLLLLFKPGGRGGVPFVFPIGDELQFVDIARFRSLLVLLFLHLLFVVVVSLSRPRRRRCCHLLIHKREESRHSRRVKHLKKHPLFLFVFWALGVSSLNLLNLGSHQMPNQSIKRIRISFRT